ncbi:hypothetical protein [uncultured Desulfovibrio sp.]|nr:hypothetical protein [uncultured Desulfovibrio sp.]
MSGILAAKAGAQGKKKKLSLSVIRGAAASQFAFEKRRNALRPQ